MKNLKVAFLSLLIVAITSIAASAQTTRFVHVIPGSNIKNNDGTPANQNKYNNIALFDFAGAISSLPPVWLCTQTFYLCAIRIDTPAGGTATDQQILNALRAKYISNGNTFVPGAPFTVVLNGLSYTITPFYRTAP